jgi:hypothetical protein
MRLCFGNFQLTVNKIGIFCCDLIQNNNCCYEQILFKNHFMNIIVIDKFSSYIKKFANIFNFFRLFFLFVNLISVVMMFCLVYTSPITFHFLLNFQIKYPLSFDCIAYFKLDTSKGICYQIHVREFFLPYFEFNKFCFPIVLFFLQFDHFSSI